MKTFSMATLLTMSCIQCDGLEAANYTFIDFAALCDFKAFSSTLNSINLSSIQNFKIFWKIYR